VGEGDRFLDAGCKVFDLGDAIRDCDVGKRKLKVCQKVTGVPLNKRHDCVTAGKAFAYLAIPFHFTGIHTPITARVTVFAKEPGAPHYAKAGTTTLRFAP